MATSRVALKILKCETQGTCFIAKYGQLNIDCKGFCYKRTVNHAVV